ncbi:DUF2726 domain-containing protein [Roseospirillum parvum]|uniref:DUF2726 domain-containing protein n=1 Tax=Roseospirillum parvum TaxID=83401 RepID=A0A1G8EI41_9PROT|nr:DUF2726 domain-containing protein [Roseospirillum parvum]SDH69593.1 Protein of unknown function [Roseospirillum parvum]
MLDLITGIAVGIVATALSLEVKKQKNKRIFKRYDLSDAGNQLRFIEEVKLYRKRPINRESYEHFRYIEQHLKNRQEGLRILAEVGLGAFIGTSDAASTEKQRKRAFSSYNSKRVDFLVIDAFGNPAVAIEYHGSGHHLSPDAVARDAVKKRALQKAGIELLEIYPNAHKPEVLARLDAILARHAGTTGRLAAPHRPHLQAVAVGA